MHYSKEEKAMRLEDWRESGKSAWAYAKEKGLNPQTFVKWTRTKPEAKACFVEVPAQVISPLLYTPEILIEKGELRIHIPLSVGLSEFRTVIEGLGFTL
jgi:uncharacterized protein (DUF2252 family)